VERRRWLGPGDHLTSELVIDLRLADGDWRPTAEDLVVVVEPCYGGVAVAAALDAGWDSVEIAEPVDDAAPIPLVSFEQPVPREHPDATRCRVRAADLAATLERITADEATPVLAVPANARPAMSSLARACGACARVTFVPAWHVPVLEVDEDDEPAEPLTMDGIWAAGMLVRVLLEELDDERAVRLSDSAGVAVAIAQGAEAPAPQLAAGARWRDHVATGGAEDDLRLAAAIDSIGAVPIVRFDDVEGVLVASAWSVQHVP
jgi:hypothetical protein